MKPRHYLWLLVAGLGLVAGRAIPRVQSAPNQGSTSHGGPHAHAPPAGASAPESPGTPAVKLTLPVSAETLESLLAYPEKDLYAPLALWLLDASAEDMARFWSSYRPRGEPKGTIRDLVFSQWVKRDPQALLAAARRGDEEAAAWSAWTMVDPDAALAAVKDRPGMRQAVLLRISHSDPQRALEMLKEDPALIGSFNVWKLAERLGQDDPAAGVDFLHQLPGARYSLEPAFAHWVKQDPRAAFAWLNESRPSAHAGLLALLADLTVQENPELIRELAATLPAGSARRQMEATFFKQLAETDPTKAWEEARRIETPRLAAERFALLGSKLMAAKQPERALEVLGELLAKCPDAAMRNFPSIDPVDSSGLSSAVAGMSELLDDLAGWNPTLTMAEMQEAGSKEGLEPVAKKWVNSDPAGFAAWTGAQQDPELADLGAGLLAGQLKDKQDYAGALEWAARISGEDKRTSAVAQSFLAWTKTDRDGALQWLDGEQLPDEVTNILKSLSQSDTP